MFHLGIYRGVAAGSPPTLSSAVNAISTSVGDIDGGYTVTLTGTNFTGATGVTFGGTSATAVVVVNATTITCTAPAHSSGVVDVIVTTPSGSNSAGNNAWEYFSPAQQSMSAWWRSYTGTLPWAATASAGGSSTTGALVTAGVSDPTAGTALNGKGVAHFDGSANYAINGTTAQGNVWSTTGGLIIALVKFNSESTATGTSYNDPPIIENTNYDCGLTVSLSGATGFGYDGAYEIPTPAPVSTGVYHFIMLRWNGSTIGITVDTGAESTHALGTITIMNGTLIVGKWAGGAKYAAMDLAELMCSLATVTNAVRDKFRGYFSTRYNLSSI